MSPAGPAPRQPLMDNLESQTYEVFEKDPIKYSQYQQVGGAWGRGGGASYKGGGASCRGGWGHANWPRPLSKAIYKCLLDRVPEEEKDSNVQ